jgi:hypothetical protein
MYENAIHTSNVLYIPRQNESGKHMFAVVNFCNLRLMFLLPECDIDSAAMSMEKYNLDKFLGGVVFALSNRSDKTLVHLEMKFCACSSTFYDFPHSERWF